MRPWEFGRIDAQQWTEAVAIQREYHDAIAEVNDEAAGYRAQMTG